MGCFWAYMEECNSIPSKSDKPILLDYRNGVLHIGTAAVHFPSNDKELQKIRQTRGYNYKKVENYKEKLKNFFREHIHADEEIRYCLQGSGYFDVRDKDDQWIRIWIKEGDMIVLPAGIYHRFTLDKGNYVKLMRLFVGEPIWTCYNRPQEDHPARVGYVKNFVNDSKKGVALEAH
ncbi:hypothetical protein MKW92_037229 [Papaver armeniacum]|nr:hypothetical protein MKW92_037229 [Papaver armeniacum]